MIEIYRKEGWKLNPNDRVVNAILRRCEKCDGLCPCTHDSENYKNKKKKRPCTENKIKNVCECGLYVLDENYFKDKK